MCSSEARVRGRARTFVFVNIIVDNRPGIAIPLVASPVGEQVRHHLGRPVVVILHRSKEQLRSACHHLGELWVRNLWHGDQSILCFANKTVLTIDTNGCRLTQTQAVCTIFAGLVGICKGELCLRYQLNALADTYSNDYQETT